MITLTIDLEDPTGVYAPNGRYVEMTERVLRLCDAYRRKATFFIIGQMLTAAPKLIQDIAAKGHEIAYHSRAHVSLTEETSERFRTQTKEDKDRLEQMTGKHVIGYRAPRFSLTPDCFWALDSLAELGFRYSSSIMPTNISRFGFPGAPQNVFQWPNGLIEFPMPIGNLGPLQGPYLGGIYLYLLPYSITERLLSKVGDSEVLWTYMHPYDFDLDEKFKPMPGEPWWVSFLLHKARYFAEPKIRRLLNRGPALTLAERLETVTSPDIYS